MEEIKQQDLIFWSTLILANICFVAGEGIYVFIGFIWLVMAIICLVISLREK